MKRIIVVLVLLVVAIAVAQYIPPAGGGGGGAFNTITSGTNTTAAMVVGTSASLTYTATGTINASGLQGKTAFQGNGSLVQLSTGSTTTGNCVKFDANGNTVDAGAACGSGTSSNAVFNLTTVTHSATPTFDLSSGNSFKITAQENEALTVSNQNAGQPLTVVFCQDGTGSRTLTWPSNVIGGMTVGSTASKCSVQSFLCDGTKCYATTPGVINQ